MGFFYHRLNAKVLRLGILLTAYAFFAHNFKIIIRLWPNFGCNLNKWVKDPKTVIMWQKHKQICDNHIRDNGGGKNEVFKG